MTTAISFSFSHLQSPAPKPLSKSDDFFNFSSEPTEGSDKDGSNSQAGSDEVMNTTTACTTAPKQNEKQPRVANGANGVPRGGGKVRGRGKGRPMVRKAAPKQPVEEAFTNEEYDAIWGFSTEGITEDGPGLDARPNATGTNSLPGVEVRADTLAVDEIRTDTLAVAMGEGAGESIVAI
jgi:hypothetical protein